MGELVSREFEEGFSEGFYGWLEQVGIGSFYFGLEGVMSRDCEGELSFHFLYNLLKVVGIPFNWVRKLCRGKKFVTTFSSVSYEILLKMVEEVFEVQL